MSRTVLVLGRIFHHAALEDGVGGLAVGVYDPLAKELLIELCAVRSTVVVALPMN